VLVTIADWRAVFVVNLPVGLLAMWLSYRHLAKAGERSDAGLDPPGQVLGVLTLTLLTLGLIEGGSSGWGSPLALIGLIGFVPALLGFLAVERNARHPMLPLNLFSNRTFSGATFVGLAINLGFYGELFAISLYFSACAASRRWRPGWRCCRRACSWRSRRCCRAGSPAGSGPGCRCSAACSWAPRGSRR
jgi:MFS transporter, DHA2 family, methylenomycin A resistance protein